MLTQRTHIGEQAMVTSADFRTAIARSNSADEEMLPLDTSPLASGDGHLLGEPDQT